MCNDCDWPTCIGCPNYEQPTDEGPDPDYERDLANERET